MISSPTTFFTEQTVSVLFVGMLCEQTVSVLFGKIAAKRTKNGVMRGVAPYPSRFLKKATQKLS